MKTSSTKARHDTIRQLLAQEGSLRVEDLAERLDVTTMTVRRDLAALEKLGVLVRNYGGCSIQSPMVRELSFSEKDTLCGEQKAAIARKAVEFIEPGSSLYIDTGTTALHFARTLPDSHNLDVFTNHLRVAMELFSREGFEVIVYGGRLAKQSPDLVGEMSLARVQEFRLDFAFLGADAVDPTRGEIYSADIHTAHLDRIVYRQAAKLVLLVDSTKFRKQSLTLVTRLQEGITLITDDGVSAHDLSLLRKSRAEVIVAPVREPAGSKSSS